MRFALKLQVRALASELDAIAARCREEVPELDADGTLEVTVDQILITLPFADVATADARLPEVFGPLGEEFPSSGFAVAYDLADEAYARDGFAGGLPRWLFARMSIAHEIFPREPLIMPYEIAVVRASPSTVVGLDPRWPHHRS